MLVNERQREVHVHKVNGLELRKRIVRASENIHWSIPYTHTHTHTRTHIHISSIHIQAPFYLWPFILRTKYIDHVCLSRWIFTSCISVSERFFFTLFRTSLARIGHKKSSDSEVYGTKYAWLHSIRSLVPMLYVYTLRFVALI